MKENVMVTVVSEEIGQCLKAKLTNKHQGSSKTVIIKQSEDGSWGGGSHLNLGRYIMNN